MCICAIDFVQTYLKKLAFLMIIHVYYFHDSIYAELWYLCCLTPLLMQSKKWASDLLGGPWVFIWIAMWWCSCANRFCSLPSSHPGILCRFFFFFQPYYSLFLHLFPFNFVPKWLLHPICALPGRVSFLNTLSFLAFLCYVILHSICGLWVCSLAAWGVQKLRRVIVASPWTQGKSL